MIVALNILTACFPDENYGISAIDLIWGFGTLHCLNQQIPVIKIIVLKQKTPTAVVVFYLKQKFIYSIQLLSLFIFYIILVSCNF
jgi:hypothetical protein